MTVEFAMDRLFVRQGLVIVSEDKNPRAVYEAATSGVPVLVAREAQVCFC